MYRNIGPWAAMSSGETLDQSSPKASNAWDKDLSAWASGTERGGGRAEAAILLCQFLCLCDPLLGSHLAQGIHQKIRSLRAKSSAMSTLESCWLRWLQSSLQEAGASWHPQGGGGGARCRLRRRNWGGAGGGAAATLTSVGGCAGGGAIPGEAHGTAEGRGSGLLQQAAIV